MNDANDLGLISPPAVNGDGGAADFARKQVEWKDSTYKSGKKKGMPCKRHPTTGEARDLTPTEKTEQDQRIEQAFQTSGLNQSHVDAFDAIRRSSHKDGFEQVNVSRQIGAAHTFTNSLTDQQAIALAEHLSRKSQAGSTDTREAIAQDARLYLARQIDDAYRAGHGFRKLDPIPWLPSDPLMRSANPYDPIDQRMLADRREEAEDEAGAAARRQAARRLDLQRTLAAAASRLLPSEIDRNVVEIDRLYEEARNDDPNVNREDFSEELLRLMREGDVDLLYDRRYSGGLVGSYGQYMHAMIHPGHRLDTSFHDTVRTLAGRDREQDKRILAMVDRVSGSTLRGLARAAGIETSDRWADSTYRKAIRQKFASRHADERPSFSQTVFLDGERVPRAEAATALAESGLPTGAADHLEAASFARGSKDEGKWVASTYKSGPHKNQPCLRHSVTGKTKPPEEDGTRANAGQTEKPVTPAVPVLSEKTLEDFDYARKLVADDAGGEVTPDDRGAISELADSFFRSWGREQTLALIQHLRQDRNLAPARQAKGGDPVQLRLRAIFLGYKDDPRQARQALPALARGRKEPATDEPRKKGPGRGVGVKDLAARLLQAQDAAAAAPVSRGDREAQKLSDEFRKGLSDEEKIALWEHLGKGMSLFDPSHDLARRARIADAALDLRVLSKRWFSRLKE